MDKGLRLLVKRLFRQMRRASAEQYPQQFKRED